MLQNQIKDKDGNPLFVIVKNAEDNIWEYHWEDDPKQTGVIEDHNAVHTHTGSSIGLPIEGLTQEQAQQWLEKMQEYNPSVGYAICPLIK